MRLIPFILFVFVSIVSNAQSVPIGQWQDQLTYSNVPFVSLANGKAYAAAESGLFSVDPSENSISRLSTINGLSNIKATALGSSSESAPLFVGYEDGVIDVVSGSSISPVVDIRRSNIIGNKQVNHFNFYTNEICFVSTGFGILQYDLLKNEIKETFLIGESGSYVFVNSSTVFEGALWAATNSGVYSARMSDDLFDPASWIKDQSLNDSVTTYNNITTYQNTLLVNRYQEGFRNDQLLLYNGSSWDTILDENPESFRGLKAVGELLVVANSTSVEVYRNGDFTNQVQRLFAIDEQGILPRSVAYSAAGHIWTGTFNKGLIQSRSAFDNDQYLIPGPVSTKAFRLNYSFDEIFVSGGGNSDIQVRTNTRAEVSKFDGTDWTLYYSETISALDSLEDILNTAFNPIIPTQFAAASMNNGLIIFDNDEIEVVYNAENSPLESISGADATFVTGVQYDANGNLWISNSITGSPLKVLTAENEWITFASNTGDAPKTNQLLVTGNNQVWQIRPGNGIYILGHNGTLNNFNDDDLLLLQEGAGNGKLTSNDVTAMAEDADGNVWVGTNIGLTVYYNAANILDVNSFDGSEILITQDGQTQVLFENQFITDIVVDPANRKWFSTRGAGVYLMSADGTQELAHFTAENSPLYSNNVNSLAILPKTGELFMGTEQGIISYRSDATIGNEDLEELLVFPNPVPPNYSGSVGISGLTNNAEVIISDVGGSVVQRLTSNGGQAVWNLLNLNGSPVQSGVYLVYVVSEEGDQKAVSKVLVER